MVTYTHFIVKGVNRLCTYAFIFYTKYNIRGESDTKQSPNLILFDGFLCVFVGVVVVSLKL